MSHSSPAAASSGGNPGMAPTKPIAPDDRLLPPPAIPAILGGGGGGMIAAATEASGV
ncbi:MAG: hypothetical protein PUF51_03030 [Bifidobacteriaceae bacterium]|nr:hypothetical protein [Bifidobacteriaceae bacterium]